MQTLCLLAVRLQIKAAGTCKEKSAFHNEDENRSRGNDLRLRLSDNLSCAIEFDANSAKNLQTGIRYAWQEWRKKTGDKHRKQLSLHIYDERQRQWWDATPEGDLIVNDMFAGDNDYHSIWEQVIKMDKYLEEFYGFIDPMLDETVAEMNRQRREEAKRKFKIVSRRVQGKTDK